MANWFTRRVAFWKSGIVNPLKVVIVGILLLILPTIAIFRDVVLSPEHRDFYLLKYIPKWSWYWWAIGVLVGLLIFLEETNFRANKSSLLQQRSKYVKRMGRQRERHRQELTSVQLQELVAVQRAALQPSEQAKPQQESEAVEINAPNAKPVLECAYNETIKVRVDGNNRITKDEQGSNQAALAYFHCKPLPDSEPCINVRAKITFHNSDFNRKERVRDGVWYKNERKEITFHLADTHPLVIALFGEQVATYEYSLHPGRRPFFTPFLLPQIDILKGQQFYIDVQLIGQKSGELIVDETFRFILEVEPEFKLVEIKSLSTVNPPSESPARRQYKIDRLNEFVKESDSFGWVTLNHENAMRMRSFNDKVETFLTDYYDESTVERFKKEGSNVLHELLKKLLDEA